jgi:hypothetical protein
MELLFSVFEITVFISKTLLKSSRNAILNALTDLSNDSINYFVLFFIDPRTKDWFLMSSPLPTLCICAAYVFTVKVAGPRLMANRKPMELRNVLIVYNLFQVLFSSWLFYEVSVDV